MSTQGRALLVDVSNSRTKFVLLGRDGGFSPVRMLPTAEMAVDSVRALLAGWVFPRATIASVVPAATPILTEALVCPVHWLGAASKLNLRLRYEHPEKLGADRLAGAMALARDGALPAIAVDAGTAVTFDLVVHEPCGPVFAGGAIAPGLRTMMHALAGRTAQLPQVPLEAEPPAVGRDTVACMQSGLLHGFAGMVRGVLQAMAAELPCAPRIVLTGGDAGLLAPKTDMPCAVDKWLVFRGLAVADELNH